MDLSPSSGMDFRLLGPVEVSFDGVALPISAMRQRAVLTALLLPVGRVVPVGALVDLLWGERPPPTAAVTVRNYISRLRKSVPAVRFVGGGYRIAAVAETVDLNRFERLTTAARPLVAEQPAAAVALLNEALAMWRGPALADLAGSPLHELEAPRMEEMRLAAVGDRIDALLVSGSCGWLVPELVWLVGRHPLRERFVGQLMEALHAAGRLPEALDLYRRTRGRLVSDLAVEPGPDLRRIHRQLLSVSIGGR